MPGVGRVGPYRFHFYSNEGDEPPHIHVRRESKKAKFWLKPVALAGSSGFSSLELRRIERIVTANREALAEAWDEYFNH